MSTAMGRSPDQNPPAGGATTTRRPRAKSDRQRLVGEQKEQFGGIKWGSAFFGWLTATGTAVLLISLLGAVGTVAGMPTGSKAGELVEQASGQAETIGLLGAVALLAILLVAYFSGGYVAGRMARFNGLKQGVAVWVWGLVVAVGVGVLAVVAGDRFNITKQLHNFPSLPINRDEVTTGGLLALAAILVTSLVGAALGGLTGMRFHRRVDKAGYDE